MSHALPARSAAAKYTKWNGRFSNAEAAVSLIYLARQTSRGAVRGGYSSAGLASASSWMALWNSESSGIVMPIEL